MKNSNRFISTTLILLFLTLMFASQNSQELLAATKQQANKPLEIHFTRVINLRTDLHEPIYNFLTAHPENIPNGIDEFTVTVAHEFSDKTVLITLVPTAVHESNWTLPLPDEHVIRLLISPTERESWDVQFLSLAAESQLKEPEGDDYRFPWTGGDTWIKTQGFHDNTLGYSLDFIPNGNPPVVRSIESGILTSMCADSWQGMVKVDHGSDESGYLHLDVNTIPTGLFNQNIPRGQDLGDLYNGTVCSNPPAACGGCAPYQYATPCGCGTGMHLHFETNALITIQGHSLQSISDAPNTTPYTSTNSGGGCCGCALANQSNSAAVTPFSSLLSPMGPYPPEPEETAVESVNFESEWAFVEEFDISEENSSMYEPETAVPPAPTILPPDTTPPTLNLIVGSGNATVNHLPVILNLNANDDRAITQIHFSADGETWSEWEPFSQRAGWQLENTTEPQTIYAQVQDAAGNLSEISHATVAADLTLERPASDSYTLARSIMGMGGGTQTSNTYTVHNTIGQIHETGTLTSGNYRLLSGYWGLVGSNLDEIYLPVVVRP